MNCYYTAGSGRKDVKNLGWLVRHLSEWTVFKVFVKPAGRGAKYDCELTVVFDNGVTFHSHFASRMVCRQWLYNRRVLKGVILNWMGLETTCDAHVPALDSFMSEATKRRLKEWRSNFPASSSPARSKRAGIR